MKEWTEERKVGNDPRVVPFGRFLRKTSLDELPQLLNIFIGKMSFVGPRAITKEELTMHYSPEQQKILTSCRPGLTGYWQVVARNEANYNSGKRIRLEMTYFEKRSLGFDLYLLFATVPAIFKHQGE